MALEAEDGRWLDAAARMATPWLGTTADNPTVGALVVSNGRLLGRGVTAPGGRPHAEPQALAMAGAAARGATLYVTLEPCNHHGRTPPCADAIIGAGIARVVVGVFDPDPRTAGQGIARLIRYGTAVELAGHIGSRRLHEGFISRVTRRRPFVTVKLAVSADGMVGRRDRPNLAITGPEAGAWRQMQRTISDAVMVGASTAVIDDPLLTVRLLGLEARSPRRIVLAGRGPMPAGLRLFAESTVPTSVIAAETAPYDLPPHVDTIAVPALDGRPDLAAAMAALGARGVQRLLVEPGAVLAEALLSAGLVDRFELLESARVIGPGGLASTTHAGGVRARLAEAGLVAIDQAALGDDKLTTFERAS